MRTAKVFMNGRSQAVRLPAEFRFSGDEIFIRRDERTGEIILSGRPAADDWPGFFDARDAARRELADFLADRGDAPPQARNR